MATLSNDELRALWTEVVTYDPTQETALVGPDFNLRRARDAYMLAQETLGKASRSRGPNKFARVENAEALVAAARVPFEAAQAAYDEAIQPFNRLSWLNVKRLYAEVAAAFFGEGFRYVESHGTGQFKKATYGREPYEVHTFNYSDTLDPESCFAVEKDGIRLRFQTHARDGAVSYELQGLSSKEFLTGGVVPSNDFGYHATAEWDTNWREGGYRAKASWGSYSGMDTLDDCERMLAIYQTAVKLGRFMEATLPKVRPTKAR